ncbi:RNA polymerase sigma factor [Lignipirellula cremea]|uniref:ECF RNA polymerase sigma-E factor n=1 Tax=Lignipirellula cremea TaxID=2528010 RepID=A0A518E4Y4_9BACT|nr:RNA polymerase sigma factor [Lignipirellula cremea]QDU99146.1 ECF RNA polymerase sigma-E factor [Lignipirellula cremea]
MATSETDRLLIDRIRQGDSDAWSDLIARYEGRLLAFVESRIGKRANSEDIVQEAFVGFLNSLPNYDGKRSLETYLFSICAYKMTDYLRREGRRPSVPLSTGSDSGGDWEISSRNRGASSIVRSGEQQHLEEKALVEALTQQVAYWRSRNDWVKIQCVELLFVRGWANKEAATELGISEQHVANYKFEFLSKVRSHVRGQELSEDIFPELYEEQS